MAAVSVIVLVYNVRDYIAQCARSLFGQTLEDIEYIFVDDCSGDESIEILEKILEEEFPERKGSVKILRNDRNRGQAWCRRLAVENAAGEYIIHCDSDDWPEIDM
ncbi:MAG: glycosyltransferase family 2 protein [Bacteroidales bacterium]|nr:glycosyltransferase family 2 protein [Bacteroidales bacterium]